MALAKSKPSSINYGSAGTGSSPHLAGELFKLKTGIDIVHVPYKGTAPSITDLIAGRIQATFTPLPGVKQHVDSGKLRLLATTEEKRFVGYESLPTVSESGVPGYQVTQWWGIIVPAGTPTPIISKINRDVATVLSKHTVASQLVERGAYAAPTSTADFDSMIRITMWEKS